MRKYEWAHLNIQWHTNEVVTLYGLVKLTIEVITLSLPPKWLPPPPQSQGKEFMNTLLYFIYNINLCNFTLWNLRLDFLGSNQLPLLRNQLWQFLCFSIVKAFVSGHVNSVLSHALTQLNKRAIYWLMCLLYSMCKTSNW